MLVDGAMHPFRSNIFKPKIIIMKKLLIICVVLFTVSAVFAQKAKSNIQHKDKASTFTVYTCSMHPEVVMDKPGKCPKCGMELTASKKEQLKLKETKGYTCTMHPEVRSTSEGKCPKCGMSLTASKKEQLKMKEMKGYACPMHPDEKSDKAGKCPKCGMALTKKN
jgi:uncharacterized paraquat-inducible protein A